MAKDSYWFKHDSTSGRGLRMRKMAHIYGHWGKGVYWDVIEILRDQNNYCFDSDDSSLQMLSDLIGCKDEAKFITWFKDCLRFELFEITGKKFFSAVLCENMNAWETKKTNGSKPKPKRNASEIEAKPEAKLKRNGSIREEERIEENKIAFETLKFELFNSGVWISDCERTLKTKNIKMLLTQFLDDLWLKEDFFKDIKEIKSHFVNWAKLEIPKKIKVNSVDDGIL